MMTEQKQSDATYPRWVKCSERLPEVGVFVFVSKNEHVQNEPVYRLNPPSAGLWFSGRAKWFSDAFTHWLDIGPIPPPPKVEEKKDSVCKEGYEKARQVWPMLSWEIFEYT